MAFLDLMNAYSLDTNSSYIKEVPPLLLEGWFTNNFVSDN